jgi:hypothetical protein
MCTVSSHYAISFEQTDKVQYCIYNYQLLSFSFDHLFVKKILLYYCMSKNLRDL